MVSPPLGTADRVPRVSRFHPPTKSSKLASNVSSLLDPPAICRLLAPPSEDRPMSRLSPMQLWRLVYTPYNAMVHGVLYEGLGTENATYRRTPNKAGTLRPGGHTYNR